MKSRVSRNVHPGDPVRYVLQTGELGLAARAELVKRVAAGEEEVEVLAELLVREGKGVAST